jgi:hypothetical protein|tara:strand:- start:67 stop:1482 length:1416 start_codon:yes stop_codon:yes gene_type:complete
MVDTLAPKRIFTQRELDQKLTPVTEQVLRTRPRERLLDVVPRITTEPSLLDKQTDEAMQDSKKQTGQIMTEEQGQTAKSSEEAIKEKQTGMKVSTEAERGQGLVMRPMEYAAKGYNDKKVSGPILVGEKGPEMIVPTGEGKISILPNSIVQGMMSMPMKKAEKGADDIMIGRPEMPKLERIVTPEVKARELAEGVSTTPVFAGNPVAEEFSLGRMGYRQFVEPVLDSLRTAVYDASPEVGMSVDKYTESSIPNYSPGAISFAVEQKYEKEIEPKLVKEMNNLPQNLDGTDISGSLRDAYRHSYTAGMMNLIAGKRFGIDVANLVGQRSQELGQLTGDESLAIREEVAMDVNNNRVGFNIANQVREDLGISSGERLTGDRLKEAEELYSKYHTQAYMNDVARYIDGDNLVPEYERTGDTNFKAYVKDIMNDDKDRNLILSYGPNKREEVENMMQNRAPSRARPSAGIMNPAR